VTAALAVEIRDLEKIYRRRFSLFGPARPDVHALRGVSLGVPAGQTLGIVGESGCGKSTLARCLVGLVRPTAGTILIEGQAVADLAASGPRALGTAIQYVFQDPHSSLNPRKSIRQILGSPLRFLARMDGRQREARLVELMRSVELDPPFLDRYPHELSGGQAQRIGIARGLAAGARIIVLDEPVSALDVSVQAQVLRLLTELKQRHGLTYVFISHDLAVVEAIADEVVVMQDGLVVEAGPPERLFQAPVHGYTQRLIASVPTLHI
jgi:ABC-type glutathione transport system ATPase component